jgi:hypothetical protein
MQKFLIFGKILPANVKTVVRGYYKLCFWMFLSTYFYPVEVHIMSVLMGRFLVSVFAEEDDGTGGRGSCGAGTLRSRSDIGGA